ncbi:M23 family metallopeptidase [Patescibacteria group bacterium]
MAHQHTHKLRLPLGEYRVSGAGFGDDCSYNGVHWGIHLGEDVNCKAGTKVFAIGRGKVVYAKLHAGTLEKGNWGHIAIIAHKHPKTKKVFFSLYGHLGKLFVKKGDRIEIGQTIGVIGKSNTPENGFWKTEHIHFAIFTGPWNGKVLPGYFKKGQNRTRLEWWVSPSGFVGKYSK